MKTKLLLICFLITTYNFTNAQKNSTMMIKKYGTIEVSDDLINQPNPNEQYNILMRITKDIEHNGVNKTLWHVARLYNLLHSANVPKENIHIVVLFSGKGYDVVFNNETYKKKMGKDNPNLELINELTARDISLHLCGQTVSDNNINAKTEIIPSVKIVYSAMTDVLYYSKKGYFIFE